jgi:iron(III) transport system substrate-binding protein
MAGVKAGGGARSVTGRQAAAARSLVIALATAAALAACGEADRGPEGETAAAASPGEVNLYTARHYDADLKLYEQFTERTGIKVNRIEGNADQLIARVGAEGAASPADVFVVSDAGALWRVQNAGLFAPAGSDALMQAVPAEYRDAEGRWFGFTRRARVVAYDSAKVQPEEVDTYEELAGPRFRGKLCVRAADNPYNLSLTAALVEAWGGERTAEWAAGVVANMARPPEGGDRDQIRAVGAGVCEIAITNSYYYFLLANGEDASDRDVTQRVKLAFPSLDGAGVHVNISGGGLLANAPNPENGVRLLEYLASAEAQALVAAHNFEYPVSPAVTPPPALSDHLDFTAHPTPVAAYGPHLAEALDIMSAAGWR